ncbi:lrpprc protein [Salpingoeca rosetta]|uniref:Lrpprc protein n=1 Tax=Salpingoeca rosetta (strain ATCC 50818 / BSB-021) TaxID=946362 RepID=F2U1S0_SALR5|nr:lrpprc protein [Salpingoeca rosetta]EGD81572.1 lrpprc protein [Salpingoeca rosetta]|eukprot:XP_004996776.1 lrpprc protein [Salpingoeca rosetta]
MPKEGGGASRHDYGVIREGPQPALKQTMSAEEGSLLSTRWLKWTRRFQVAAMLGTTAYLVFFHDFGQQDHCFKPIRKFVKDKYDSFLTPTPAELAEIEQLKQTQTAQAATATAAAQHASTQSSATSQQ